MTTQPQLYYMPLFTDNFTRANEDPLNPTTWGYSATAATAFASAFAFGQAEHFSVSGNLCIPDGTSGTGAALQNPIVNLPEDCYVQYTVAALGSTIDNGIVYIFLRSSNDLKTCVQYEVSTNHSGSTIWAVSCSLISTGLTHPKTVFFNNSVSVPSLPATITVVAIGTLAFMLLNGTLVPNCSGTVPSSAGGTTAMLGEIYIVNNDVQISQFTAGQVINMSINVRTDRIFPGLGVPLRNDTVFLQTGIALSGTVQVSTPIPAASIGTLPITTTCGAIRFKVYNGGGTTPTLTDIVCTAGDGTNTVTIGQSVLHPTVAITLSTTSWFEFEFEYILDTASSGAGGGAAGQLSGVVGGANQFHLLLTLGGTTPTASLDVELCPLI